MSNELRFREASKSDLPDVLRLYAQPDLDDVGTFALLIMDNLGHLGTPSAIIEDVAVDPTLQGQGIGRQMMRHALQLAAANGCYKAALS
jgi:GNAT superfamily N-acetyltransferase